MKRIAILVSVIALREEPGGEEVHHRIRRRLSIPRAVRPVVRPRAWLAALVVALLPGVSGLGAAPTGAQEVLPAIRECAPDAPPMPDSPRLRVDEVAGRTVIVLLPPGYENESRRYPVLYLLHGGATEVDCWVRMTSLYRFTEEQPPDRQAIVVMPDGGATSFWADWRRGIQYESILRESIIPHVDAAYRTLPGRSHRAVAGFSAGGGGAISFAARNPDRFVAAASFSGFVDPDPDRPGDIVLVGGATVAEPSSDLFAAFGDPVTEAVWWRNVNPAHLARNLAGTTVWFAVGDGRNCDVQDVEEAVVRYQLNPLVAAGEAYVHEHAEKLHVGLTDAGVAHTYDQYGCGIHSPRYMERNLREFWDVMHEAFGSADPGSFDIRRADPTFSSYGWTFAADSARAAEFLTISGASPQRLTLTGSGPTTVRTAPLFEPGALVELTGAVETNVTSDEWGRITFRVDLGPPHEHQQFTPQQRVIEAAEGHDYWRTAEVTFAPQTSPHRGRALGRWKR